MNVLSLFDLKGEKAIVTGAARGLGEQMAMALAEAGADVAVVADKDIDGLRRVSENIQNLGVNSILIKADVREISDVENMVRVVKDKFKKIDILVNNAGVVSWSPAEEMSLEEWKRVIDINLTGVFLCCQLVGREMIKQRKGSIINISSISGFIVNYPQKQCHYNASKAAVHHLTKSLAVEWAPYNIRVNAICPGYMATPLLKLADEKLLEEWASFTPQKRIGEPSEIKGLCVFLASKASSYVTGATILIDGGYTAL